MTNNRNENPKALATLELRGQLATKMDELYPPATDAEVLARYLNREETHVRFPINNPRLMQEVIPVALKNAIEMDSARSTHGEEHATYKPAIRAVLQDIDRGGSNTGVETQKHWYTHPLPSGGEHTIGVERLVVQTGPFERHTHAPRPAVEADKILQDSNRDNPKHIDRQMRKVALDYGMPAALITAAHMGWEVADLQRAFRPEQQRQQLREQGTNGKIIPDPGTKGEQLGDFYRMYGELRAAMRYRDGAKELPRRSAGAFEVAVDVLSRHDAFSRRRDVELHERKSLGTIPVVQVSTAIVPLAAAGEEASSNAPNDLQNPARDEAIHTMYGRQSTTKVITAYLDVHRIRKLEE